MRLLVTMRVVESSSYSETRDAISHDWINYLNRFSIHPIFVPNTMPDPEIYFEIGNPSGLLLTGGNNLGEYLDDYDHQTIPFRDKTEMRLLEIALEKKIPILGVCRGLQLINHYFGGKIDRLLPTSHVAVNHEVRITEPTPFEFDVNSITVNSYHNQGVAKNSLARDLRSFAISDDNTIEGLYHPELTIYAVQWHPERPGPSDGFDQGLMMKWLGKCG